MGQVRHGSATTTHAGRAAIRRSQASITELSRELGINPKTVAKSRKRETVDDRKIGPKAPRSAVLSAAEEAIIVAFRRHTLLPLNDCLYALRPSMPHQTRSSLRRCLQGYDISRLPDMGGDQHERQRFKRYPIGDFRIDIAEVRTEEASSISLLSLIEPANSRLRCLSTKPTERRPGNSSNTCSKLYHKKIHTILTDNGIQFAINSTRRTRPKGVSLAF